MRVFILLLLVSGCVGAPPLPDPDPPTTDAEPSLPDALDLLAVADAEAKAWNPQAKLTLLITFEGALPRYTDPLRSDNPWVEPYYQVEDPVIADGRSVLWSFSYAVDDVVHDVAKDVCGAGAHVELREVHVVTVDASGDIVASYETRDDDEGAAPAGFLPPDFGGSKWAADILSARTDKDLKAEQAIWSRTTLRTDWYWAKPVWDFILDIDEFERAFYAVDAVTGEVLADSAPPTPPC